MYSLRTSNSGDAEFAYHTIKVTMRDYAIQTWGTWFDEESKQAAINDTARGKIEVIYVSEIQAGTLQVEISESEMLINQFYLLPEFQNKGIGTQILKDLKREATEKLIPIKLSVLQVNPAQRFYRRNGFLVDSETVERVHMKHIP